MNLTDHQQVGDVASPSGSGGPDISIHQVHQPAMPASLGVAQQASSGAGRALLADGAVSGSAISSCSQPPGATLSGSGGPAQQAHREPPRCGERPKCHPLTFKRRKVHFWRALTELNNISKKIFFCSSVFPRFSFRHSVNGRSGRNLDPHPVTIMHTPSNPPFAAPGEWRPAVSCWAEKVGQMWLRLVIRSDCGPRYAQTRAACCLCALHNVFL